MSKEPCGPAIDEFRPPHDKGLCKTPFNPRCLKVLALARVLESIVYGVVLMNLWGQVAHRSNLQLLLLVSATIEPATQLEQRAVWFIAGWGQFKDVLATH